MDRKIIFIPFGSVLVKPIVVGGGNELPHPCPLLSRTGWERTMSPAGKHAHAIVSPAEAGSGFI